MFLSLMRDNNSNNKKTCYLNYYNYSNFCLKKLCLYVMSLNDHQST